MFVFEENDVTHLSDKIIESNKEIVLIKDNSGSVLSKVKDYLQNKNSLNRCFYENLKYSNYYEPYFPFLSFINQDMKRIGILPRDYFERIDIYPMHRQIFESYVVNNKAERNEEVIPFDYKFEKYKLYESFFNILCKFGNSENVYIILENINYMSSSTLRWLLWFVKHPRSYRIKFVLTLTSYEYHINEYQEEFENLIETIESEYALIENDPGTYNRLNVRRINRQTKNVEDILSISENLFQFFAEKEALDYLFDCYKDLAKGKFNTDYEHVVRRIGDIYLLNGEYDKSYEYYSTLLNKSVEANNLACISRTFLKLSMLDILTIKFNRAESFAQKAYKIAREIDNEYLILCSYKAFFWINEKGIYKRRRDELNVSDKIIMYSEKYNQNNFLAYFLTHSFNSGNVEDSDKISSYDIGCKIARDLKNDNCILSAHLKTALDYGAKGDFNKSRDYYKKVEYILNESEDNFCLAQTYNGIGYYCMIHGKYKSAEKHYNKALNILKSNWNFDEICITLVNKSLNSMLIYDYNTAEKELEILRYVITELKLDKLRLTTLSQVYGIMALNHCFLGNSYRSYAFLGKMRSLIKDKGYYEEDEEKFLFNFTQGMLFKRKNIIANSEKCFQEAFYYINKINGSLRCFYPRLVSVYKEILLVDNKYDEINVLENAEQDYCIRYNLKKTLESYNDEECNCDFGSYLNHITWILEAVKQEAAISSLNQKVEEINFINSFQEILASMNEKNEIIKNAIMLLENRFSIDYSLFVVCDEGKSELLYSKDIKYISDIKLSIFNTLINKYENAFVSQKQHELKNYIAGLTGYKIDSVLYIPIIKENNLKYIFICATKAYEKNTDNKITLESANLKTINIVIHQLSEVIQRIKWQEKLVITASTDMLTGLYNRQYFYKKLNDVITSCNSDYITLFYIDLDNFKYYNDTFGHNIGDLVLIWFSRLLEECAGKFSTVVRFGGDEFLLLSEKCDENKAAKISCAIYDKLEELCGFKGKIEKVYNKNIDIPLQYVLSCSMGVITSKINTILNANEFIDEADKCLYKAKNSGKGRFIMYRDKS